MEKYPPGWSKDDYEEAAELVAEIGAGGTEFATDAVHAEAMRRRATRSGGNGASGTYRMMVERHQVVRALAFLERDGMLDRAPGAPFDRWRIKGPAPPYRPMRAVYQGPATLHQGNLRLDGDCAITVPADAAAENWNGRFIGPKDALETGPASLLLPNHDPLRIRLTSVYVSGFCEFIGEGMVPKITDE